MNVHQLLALMDRYAPVCNVLLVACALLVAFLEAHP